MPYVEVNGTLVQALFFGNRIGVLRTHKRDGCGFRSDALALMLPVSREQTVRRSRSATEIDHHVGARLRVRRIEIGLSQEALGERLGVSFQQVQKYERGTNRISASRLFMLASALSVPVQFFFDGLDDEAPRTADQEGEKFYRFISSSDGVALALAFSKISDQKIRRGVIDLVRTLSD